MTFLLVNFCQRGRQESIRGISVCLFVSMFVITSKLWIISGLFHVMMSISSSSDCFSFWKHIILAILPGHVDPIWWSSYFHWYLWLKNFMIAIWPGLSIIFHWKSPSLSAVERYFSVVRPFNQLRNRFFFRFKIWPKYFFCRGFCDPPWRSPSPAFSSPSSSHFPTISCSPQCASRHNQLAEFVTSFLFSLSNYSPACQLFSFYNRERLVLSDSPLNSTFLQVCPLVKKFRAE